MSKCETSLQSISEIRTVVLKHFYYITLFDNLHIEIILFVIILKIKIALNKFYWKLGKNVLNFLEIHLNIQNCYKCFYRF